MSQRLLVITIMVLSTGMFVSLASLAWQNWINQPTPQSNVQPPRLDTDDPILIGAGDISSCANDFDEATAKLIDEVHGTVFTLGDNVYPGGRSKEFDECYGPTWGRFRDRTYPAVGNHEYVAEGAAGYFSYFGARAGESSRGYYRYAIGDWQVYVLNSNCGEVGGCGADSPQAEWLRKNLADHPSQCAIAMMHHPPYSSALHGNTASVEALWQILVTGGVDLVLAGHDHDYERFAPLNVNGEVDVQNGARLFVVGTGGRSLYGFRTIQAGSEVRNNQTYGVLKLTLHAGAYSWKFLPIAGQTFTDSGSEKCR